MIKPHHKKIAIVGCGGSGKTTLAFKLQEHLNLPLHHLDQYYWKPGWQRPELEDFAQAHSDLCAQDAWIIEGSYYRFFYERAKQADVIIFLDVPRYKCLWYVLKRSVLNLGKVIPGNPSGCKQQVFNGAFLQFLFWIWNFNKRYKSMVFDTLDECQGEDNKQIYILKSFKEAELFMESLW